MGTVYAEIMLKNATDMGDVQRGYRAEKDVRYGRWWIPARGPWLSTRRCGSSWGLR
jgi:hypothetical protein